MHKCCFCCSTRTGSLAVGLGTIPLRCLIIYGYIQMINPDRYQAVKLYREDDTGAVDVHKVAYSIIIESCLDIVLSLVLFYGVKYDRSTLVLLWLYWQFINTLFTSVIASMQVIAAVFASSTYALVGVMASWTTVFLMVYCMKCVGAYYYELTLSECDDGNAETTASLMEDAWKNQQQLSPLMAQQHAANACTALAQRMHCVVPTDQIDQPSCSKMSSACNCTCAAAALAMTPPPHAPSRTSISVQTEIDDDQIAVANV